MPKRDELLLQISLGFLVLFWGLAFVAIEIALRHMSWITLTFLRFASAAMFFVGYLAVARPSPRIERRDLPIIAALGFLGFTGYHLFLNLGQSDPATTAGTSALVISSVPAFIAVLAAWHLREALNALRTAGIALAFAGLAVMLLLGAPGSELRVTFTPSAALIVPSAIFAAFYAVLAKPYLKKYRPFQLVAYAILFGTAFTLPLVAADAGRTASDIATMGLEGWLPILYLGVFPTFLAYGIWFRAMQKMEASAVGTYVYLSTLVAVLAGVYFLGESLTLPLVLGGAMVIAGVYLAQRKK